MVRITKILEIISEDKLCDNTARCGTYLTDELVRISQQYDMISNVRGRGLMAAFDFPDKKTRDNFIRKGLDHNVMFLGCGDKTIRFRPALIMDRNHIDIGMQTIQKISL